MQLPLEKIIRYESKDGIHVTARDISELVRCKDCKYSDECHKTVHYTRRENRTSMTMGSVPLEYCSRGERKDDAEQV